MPILYIICGAAGVGKSTYGRQLAGEKLACLLDSDSVTEPVVRAGMALGGLDPNDRDSSEYRAAFRLPVYECLFQVAKENLIHTDVVMVGPFTSEIQDPEWPARLKDRFHVEVKVIFLSCEEKTRLERIRQRGNPRDLPKLANWESHLDQHHHRAPNFDCEIVNT